MNQILRFPEAIQHDPEIDAWLNAQATELGEIARTWFARLRACGSGVQELLHDGCATVCFGDAPFAYVGVYKAHVNVGFFYGAELKDPAGLLEGTGRLGRHVKLRPGTNVNAAELNKLIDASYKDIKLRLT
jgi:hypothetical protein